MCDVHEDIQETGYAGNHNLGRKELRSGLRRYKRSSGRIGGNKKPPTSMCRMTSSMVADIDT